MRATDQDKSDRKGRESLDSLIRQTIAKESLLSFPRSGENPTQLIHLLHAFEQQGGNRLSNDSTIEFGMDSIDCTRGQNGDALPFLTESSSVTYLTHSNLKEMGSFGKGQQKVKSTEHMSSLKFPEAAAKVNGEPEKYLPGWPLLSKVQMLKCEKCSREFISPINHRRHIRVHRRLSNPKKDDSQKKRADLAGFWDKLSADEASQILSLKNIMLEEVPGSSIIKAMTSFVRKPGLLSLPQFYIKAGATLLDVVQMKSSIFPLSATDLFSILDNASEKTFLCAGTALSIQRFVFAGEAGKVSLEVRNLVASMCFLVEQKLVKAWLVDKDAEALHCQKLLVEEEEAAEKKRAEQLERKRLKQLRQKELKEKEQVVNVESVDSTSSLEVGGEGSLTAAVSSPSAFSQDASSSPTLAAGCANLHKDATIAGESGIMPNADHIMSTDMDLESRASQDSVTGVPVYPELGYANHQGRLQDKVYTDGNFVRCWRDWNSSTESDLVLSQKHVSGSKTQQTILKGTKKSYNGSSSWKVSPNGVLISKSVAGQKLANNNKPLGQQTSLRGNVYSLWTKKTHQKAMPNIDTRLKTEGRPKDDTDAVYEMKLVDSLQSSSVFTYNGLTYKSTLMTAKEGLGVMAAETSRKPDVNNIVKPIVLNDDSDPSHWSNPTVTGGELLIGSMSLCLDSFPNGASKPRLVYSKGIRLDECNFSADGKNCTSISNSFDSSIECVRVPNAAGALDLRLTNDSTAKFDKPSADPSGDGNCRGHPHGQTGYGMLIKKGLWQDGVSKSVTKIWRPISHAMDCRGANDYITDCTVNSRKIEEVLASDTQGRATINKTAHLPLKHEIYMPDNLRHSICTQKGDICSSNSQSEQKVDAHQIEEQCRETVESYLRNENKVQVVNGSKEANECINRKQNEIVETIDQREIKFELACDAAEVFLSQRWEAAVMSSEAEVVECLESGAVQGPFSGVASVGSEIGHFVSGTDSETNYLLSTGFQTKYGSISSIEAVQGRQKTFDYGLGTLSGGPSSLH
ncbi:hypothetical protein KI387_013246 [Taxus chinensis]|uniref:C2H2-type domain-containing protein n=1 Tax=Taxus chinensis TaxID=29808 RepID=A0AA38CMZ5_TAXCH|nr:hypothetical protein KI387_013246 [Taxus chinensis]